MSVLATPGQDMLEMILAASGDLTQTGSVGGNATVAVAQLSSPQPTTTTHAGLAAGAGGGSGSEQPVILKYAEYLGIDTVHDMDLLWIAQHAITAELPPEWTEHNDPDSSALGASEWGVGVLGRAGDGALFSLHTCGRGYRLRYV